MLRLITDFDGPIMDISERYYQTYKFCLEQTKLPNQEVRELTKSEFWIYKRARTPETKIGIISGLNPEQGVEFAKLRQATAHTMPYFGHDQVVPGAIASLKKFQAAGVDLAVVTLRRVKELNYAFEQYPELGKLFPENRRYCLSNDYVKTTDVIDKPILMQKVVAELPPVEQVWMIGDTEADIIAAQKYSITAVGVLSGIRDRQQLETYHPDLIVDRLTDLANLIL
ncbi:HAD family hydrolase [Merismopedia glauca]|uniref:Haloacid dehalogenase n=1 Tax=Merismopedia glauca CCAP 1448/3 TaxID=1296344 RepID=A0A2T1BZ98_9CYAN|nr:HAD family hydrolase [Merismopedia glauca]PSB01356.1 haloacid dehalogenase [Merismopedia glauca CCAP 1448/3]